jgi:hypothetical protein
MRTPPAPVGRYVLHEGVGRTRRECGRCGERDERRDEAQDERARSRGARSRASPIASGPSAAPAPCTTRPATAPHESRDANALTWVIVPTGPFALVLPVRPCVGGAAAIDRSSTSKEG